MKQLHTQQQGFAMLFTVLIISIIMSIAISISNVAFKQNLLSSIAKESQVAFYAADAGVECGLYYDFTEGAFPIGTTPSTAPATLTCGGGQFSIDTANSYLNYSVYTENNAIAEKPCRNIVFNKTDPVENVIQSRGYSICGNLPRQVERALEVRY